MVVVPYLPFSASISGCIYIVNGVSTYITIAIESVGHIKGIVMLKSSVIRPAPSSWADSGTSSGIRDIAPQINKEYSPKPNHIVYTNNAQFA